MKFNSNITVPEFDGSNCDCSSASVNPPGYLTKYNVNYNQISMAIIRTPPIDTIVNKD